jgi:predicted transcriptional regulator
MRVIEFWTVGIRSCAKMYASEHKPMTETLSIRIDAETKKRLDALSKSSKRSKSCLAAEAIAAYVLSEEWQLGERQAGDRGTGIGARGQPREGLKMAQLLGKAR